MRCSAKKADRIMRQSLVRLWDKVPYRDAKSRIQSGDIILWHGRGLAARLVQWATNSYWSHAGVAIWWGPRLMVLDAYPFKGTRARPLSHDIEGAYWLPSSAVWTKDAHAFALDELDKKYSLQNLWKTWLGLNLVGREYQCAQYVAAVMKKAGVDFTAPATPESISRELPPPVQLVECI